MGTNDYRDSINGKAITYREDLDKDNYYRYSFYTNRHDLKRTLFLGYTQSTGWANYYTNAGDINK